MFPPRRLPAILASFICLGSNSVAADVSAIAKSIQQPALNRDLPTLWIAGDSTAAPGGSNSVGWGVPFPAYFDLTKVNVVNRARGGRSSRTFISDGSWDTLLVGVKPGDQVLIQFGHNDGGAINAEPPGSNRPLRARASLPGLGNESEEIENVLTKKHEVVHTFGWYMRKMIEEVRAKGATPIVLSLTIRHIWKDGKVERGSGHYGEWSAAIAKSAGAAFIDLSKLIADDYQQRGEDTVNAFFSADHTHTNATGADLNAAHVVAGLRGLPGAPIERFLSAKGRTILAAK